MIMSRISPRAARLTIGAVLAFSLAGCGIIGGKDEAKTTPTLGNRQPVLSRIESGAKVDPALASITVVLPPADVNPNWAQSGGNAQKSYGHLALSAAPQRVWSAQVAGASTRQRLAASPVVGDGRLFVYDTEGALHAFDAATGARVWQISMRNSGDGASSAFGGGVTFDNGRIYATTGTGDVAAINPADGAIFWKVKPAGPLRGSPTVAFNSVYVMTQDNQIHALSLTDGAPLWRESASVTQAGVFGVAAPAAGQGTVIAGYSSGELVAYRYENGRTLWSDALARTSISTAVATLTDVDADPIIHQGRVYALGQGGRMAAYELVTGQRIWELNLSGISTPAVAGEWIFTLTDDARMLAIARATGKVRWIAELPKWRDPEDKKGPIFWTGPVLAGDRLYAASSEGQLQAVSVADGSFTQMADLDQPVSLPPIVANQTLYVLDDSGKITAFR